MPRTLAFEAAKGCKDILAREVFPDVEVAFRESVVTQSVGSKLLSFDPDVDPVPSFLAPSLPRLEFRSLRSRRLTWKARVPSTSERAARATEDVNEIHDEVTKHWTTPNLRMVGYVVHAPAIAVDDGPNHFTRDWALIDLYSEKIDWDTFQGNKVYVGTFPSYLGNTVPSFSVCVCVFIYIQASRFHRPTLS